MKFFIMCVIMVVQSVPLYAMTGREIIDRVMQLKLPDTAVSDVSMTISTGGTVMEKAFTIHTKTFENDERKTLVEFSKPAKIKLLTYSHPDREDDQWLRLTSGKIKRITPSAKGKSFVNSNFTYEDIISRNVDDFQYRNLGEDLLSGYRCYKVESVQVKGRKVYDRTILYIRKTDFFTLRVDYYKKGKFDKYLANYAIRKIDGIITPFRVVMTSATKGKTELAVRNIRYNVPLVNSMFRKEALR